MLKPFLNFPEEAAIIGRILVGWTEIEADIIATLGDVLQDNNAAVRAILRLRGVDMRLQVADALMRPAFKRVGLADKYAATVGAIRHSKKIRNQYAHAHWCADDEFLFFMDMEKGAKTHDGDVMVRFAQIDAQLLRKQEEYLTHASDWQWFVQNQYRVMEGGLPIRAHKEPTALEPPPLRNPPTRAPRLMTEEGLLRNPKEPPVG